MCIYIWQSNHKLDSFKAWLFASDMLDVGNKFVSCLLYIWIVLFDLTVYV